MSSSGGHMSPDELLDSWRRGLRISVRAHYESAKYFERLHLMLSLPAVAVSALLGSAVFASLQHSTVAWIKTTMAVLSVVTIGLSSLQASLRFGERAERHKAAANQLGEVRRALEQQFVFMHRDEPATEALRKKWDAADRQAPTIRSRIYNNTAELIHKLGDAPAPQGSLTT
jgi:hypothetical protein